MWKKVGNKTIADGMDEKTMSATKLIYTGKGGKRKKSGGFRKLSLLSAIWRKQKKSKQ